MSSASNSKAKKTVNLKSSDGEIFEVDVSVIIGSQTIKHMIEDDCANEFIPLPNVDGKILAKVIEYCKKHHLHNDDDDDDDEAKNKKNIDKDDSSSSSTVEKVEKEEIKKMKKWDEDFLKNVDQDALYDLILASSYLEVKDLLELCCQKVADMIKGKSPEEIRTTFNIKKDFTPEEEARNPKRKQLGIPVID